MTKTENNVEHNHAIEEEFTLNDKQTKLREEYHELLEQEAIKTILKKSKMS
jgi:hypothetical protein